MATITLRPNAAGDLTQLNQYPTSGANWDKVDEVTADDDVTYVIEEDTEVPQTDLYNIENASLSGPISKITVYFRVRVFDSYISARLLIKTNGSSYYQGYTTPNNAWTTYSYDYVTNPQTGLAWTWAQIDALQIGAELKAASSESGIYSPYCTQMYVVVDYVPYIDVGLRIKTSNGIIKIGVQALEASHKLRIRKGDTTYGIPLLATNDSNASGVRIYDGANVKALPKVA